MGSGQVITVYGSKGGTGRTFVSVNLAVDLFITTRQPVLLLDFVRPVSVGVKAMLNASGIRFADAILTTAPQLKPVVLSSYFTPHDSGIQLLALTSGERPLENSGYTGDTVQGLIGKLKEQFAFLVIDAGSRWDEGTIALVAASDRVLMVVSPELETLDQARADVGRLRLQNFPVGGIGVVLNKVGLKGGADVPAAERALKLPSMAAIPYHEDVLSLQWAGPFPSHHKRHAVNRGLQGVTTALLQSFGNTPPVARASAAASAETHPADQLKLTIHRKLLSTIDFKKLDTEVENDPVKKEELEREVRRVAVALIDELAPHLVREERNTLLRQVIQETLGLGPLEDLLADTDITEIMVNRWDQIYIERSGRLIETGLQFFSDAHLVNIIGRIVGPLGRKIDISTPMVDARLPDGSRVNAVIPPLAINGASLTIRKFAQERLNMEALEAFGSLNRQVAEFLMAAVCARLNIVVSGGTGSGKTTLLNILSGYIPEGERIITIEDSAELKLHQPHVVPLECRPPNIEGKGEITIRDLLRNALRMRPDRIVVGECRGGEALDMLQAMNTGHDGSMTTIHANTTQEALARIETLVMYTGFELPSRGIKEQIAGAVDLIIQVKRFKDGSRKLIQVSELRGISEDRIRIDDVFLFNQIDEVDGTPRGMHVATGFVPESVQRFQEKGIHLPRELFWAN